MLLLIPQMSVESNQGLTYHFTQLTGDGNPAMVLAGHLDNIRYGVSSKLEFMEFSGFLAEKRQRRVRQSARRSDAYSQNGTDFRLKMAGLVGHLTAAEIIAKNRKSLRDRDFKFDRFMSANDMALTKIPDWLRQGAELGFLVGDIAPKDSAIQILQALKEKKKPVKAYTYTEEGMEKCRRNGVPAEFVKFLLPYAFEPFADQTVQASDEVIFKASGSGADPRHVRKLREALQGTDRPYQFWIYPFLEDQYGVVKEFTNRREWLHAYNQKVSIIPPAVLVTPGSEQVGVGVTLQKRGTELVITNGAGDHETANGRWAKKHNVSVIGLDLEADSVGTVRAKVFEASNLKRQPLNQDEMGMGKVPYSVKLFPYQ